MLVFVYIKVESLCFWGDVGVGGGGGGGGEEECRGELFYDCCTLDLSLNITS